MPSCQVTQLCLMLQPHGQSPPGSSVHGILQARILEWVAMLSSRGSSRPRDQTLCLLNCQAGSLPLVPPGKPSTHGAIKWKKVKSLIRVRLFVTPWTVAYQAPPSVGFSRQEYWSGLPFPSPGSLPNPGVEPGSPALQADALPSEPPGKQ